MKKMLLFCLGLFTTVVSFAQNGDGTTIPEPIVFECGKGIIQVGDLKDKASLRMYSGGMWYLKKLVLNAE